MENKSVLSLQNWINENGYDDFNIFAYAYISLKGRRIIPKTDIERIIDEVGISLEECKIIYDDYQERNNVKSVEYSFSHPYLNYLEAKIEDWVNKEGIYLSFSVFTTSIVLYDYSDEFEPYIDKFQKDFNVVLCEAKYEYKPSSGGCRKNNIIYKFSRC